MPTPTKPGDYSVYAAWLSWLCCLADYVCYAGRLAMPSVVDFVYDYFAAGLNMLAGFICLLCWLGLLAILSGWVSWVSWLSMLAFPVKFAGCLSWLCWLVGYL
jgi:hypothetical protein